MKMIDFQMAYSRLANAYYAAMSRGAFTPGSDSRFVLAGDTAPLLNLTPEQLQYRKVFGVRLVKDDAAPVGVVLLRWRIGSVELQIDVMLSVEQGVDHGGA
ncbi:MAG: hypothetical protein IPK79_00090 [Vampirovibrionales bacterium]|nr:hypothetical protein [Vampirovibrionales bacterium]